VDEILQRQRGLAKELLATLIFQHQELALDSADGLLRHVAVLGRELRRMLGNKAEHRAQILEIEEQQPLVIGDAEADIEHALLHLVEVHETRQQKRPHLGDRRPNGMALLAEQIPEHNREPVHLVVNAEALGASDKRLLGVALLGDTREVAFDIGSEDGDACVGKAFRQHLQGHGLAGSGRARNETVPIGERQREHFRLLAAANENSSVVLVTHRTPLRSGCSSGHCLSGWPNRQQQRLLWLTAGARFLTAI